MRYIVACLNQANPLVISNIYFFIRTLKMYSSNFQMHSILLFTVVAMMYSSSPDTWYPLTNIPRPLSPSPSSPPSSSVLL